MLRNHTRLRIVIAILVLIQFAMLAALSLSGFQPVEAGAPIYRIVSSDPSALLNTLVKKSTLIVRGEVTALTSYWGEDGLIYSKATLQPRYTLSGITPQQLTVTTIGGYLPDEQLRLVVSHEPSFRQNEEVLLFLRQTDDSYEVVHGAQGKYAVGNGMAVNGEFLTQTPLEQFITAVQQQLNHEDRQVVINADWQRTESEVTTVVNEVDDFVTRGYKWPTNQALYRVNINTPQVNDGLDGTAEDFINAVRRAGNTWSNVATADFTYVFDGVHTAPDVQKDDVNEIVWMQRGDSVALAYAQVWIYNGEVLEGDIWLNERYNWNATGAPANDEFDVATAVLHEMGHWLGLGHDPEQASIMYATVMAGAIRTSLGQGDLNGINALYPCATASCNPTGTEATATPTTIALPTDTATPTPTATESLPETTPAATETSVVEEATSTPTATPTLEMPAAAFQINLKPNTSTEFTAPPSNGVTAALVFPLGAVSQETVVTYQTVRATDLPSDTAGTGYSFQLEATFNNNALHSQTQTFAFNTAVFATFDYEDSTVFGIDEAQLQLLAQDPITQLWADAGCGEYVRNPEMNRFTVPICQTAHFAIAGPASSEAAFRAYLPLIGGRP